MSKLELSFLGLFSARLDGAPVTSFESNKVRALLAYLAVESQRPQPGRFERIHHQQGWEFTSVGFEGVYRPLTADGGPWSSL